MRQVSGLYRKNETFGSHAWVEVQIDGVWERYDPIPSLADETQSESLMDNPRPIPSFKNERPLTSLPGYQLFMKEHMAKINAKKDRQLKANINYRVK